MRSDDSMVAICGRFYQGKCVIHGLDSRKAITAIDTLRFARKLKQAGLPHDQAEAMAAALGEELTEHLAAKADLRLLKWMVGFNLAFSAAILWRILDLT